MHATSDRPRRLLELHRPGRPLLLANVWDAGGARILAALGFEALATTSAGHAFSLGRADGEVSRDEALAHAREVAQATPIPVSADFERGFGDAPREVADFVSEAAGTGLAGCSIEDFSGREIYPAELAAERIEAAAEAAHAGPGLVLTARSEGYLHGRRDLADAIARLQRFQEAGADVLYAPGLTDLGEIRELVASVDRPLNVLCLPGGPKVAELAEAGVARISVGSAFYLVSLAALAEAAREWREQGSHDFWSRALPGLALAKEHLGRPQPAR